MEEFWENLYKKIGTEWGFEPADSAIYASNIFAEKRFKNIMIPGIGYGRNIKPFFERGMNISGIEISKTALDMIPKSKFIRKIHEGSVLDMPFGDNLFDGIYCYALLHLFNFYQRRKIISECYKLLVENGIMIFCVSSTEYYNGSGKKIGRNRYLMPNGLKVFYYEDEDIEKEFSEYGLIEYRDIDEPVKFKEQEQAMKFKMITCSK